MANPNCSSCGRCFHVRGFRRLLSSYVYNLMLVTLFGMCKTQDKKQIEDCRTSVTVTRAVANEAGVLLPPRS